MLLRRNKGVNVELFLCTSRKRTEGAEGKLHLRLNSAGTKWK
jgi:hypothetical protein